MRYTPKQKNMRLVNGAIGCLLVLGAVTYALPIVFEARGMQLKMPWLFALLTLASVVAALFFVIRYRMTGFTYLIAMRGDIPADPMMESAYASSADLTAVRPEYLDLVVMKSQGSRTPVTECVLSLGDLAAVIPVTGFKGKGMTVRAVRDQYRERRASDFVFYDYTLTFGWEEALELIFVDGQRYVGVVLEADGALRQYLLGLKNGGENE